MNIDINGLWKDLSTGVLEIIRSAAGQYASEATQDADSFLSASKELVAQWAQELNDGKMSKDEFTFLAEGRLKELVPMHALADAGIAAATIDATRAKIVDFAITAICTRIPV